MRIRVKKLADNAIWPQQMRPGDAGIDLYAAEEKLLLPGKVEAIKTGIALEIPDGFVGNVRDRSGLAARHSLHTLGGIFDSNYRGDITIIIINLGSRDYQIKAGDRIAQMLIHKIEKVEIEEAQELSITNREDKSFGSSGY